MARYHILRGSHVSGDRKTRKLFVAGSNGESDDGDIIDSEVDLCKMFNSVGSIKFERLPDENMELVEPVKKSKKGDKQPQPT